MLKPSTVVVKMNVHHVSPARMSFCSSGLQNRLGVGLAVAGRADEGRVAVRVLRVHVAALALELGHHYRSWRQPTSECSRWMNPFNPPLLKFVYSIKS